jgi:hypothetical protein
MKDAEEITMTATNMPYNASLTAEQFFFYEMRIVAKQHLEGKTVSEIIECVKRDNLFQYPTERKISKFVRACHRRIEALGNENLVFEIVNAPVEAAKQINLYSMMRYNRLVREFMEELVGEKYRQQDFSYSKKDINVFFSRLRSLNDDVASWSERTVAKLKQVLAKCLIETQMLDSARSVALNPIFISEELEAGILENKDLSALAAFNCFRQEHDHGRHKTRA